MIFTAAGELWELKQQHTDYRTRICKLYHLYVYIIASRVPYSFRKHLTLVTFDINIFWMALHHWTCQFRMLFHNFKRFTNWKYGTKVTWHWLAFQTDRKSRIKPTPSKSNWKMKNFDAMVNNFKWNVLNVEQSEKSTTEKWIARNYSSASVNRMQTEKANGKTRTKMMEK